MTRSSPFDAHKHSASHRSEILASSTCGCFYCLETFPPAAIVEWVDELEPGDEGQTAICPKCGIDSVLGDKSGYPLNLDFLKQMHSVWFGARQ